MVHLKNIAKCVLFLSILTISLFEINKILEPKFILKNSSWPTTSSYRQFYNMDDNSIDVVFLGSSVVVNAFIPQEIYNEYGIRSYNLGSEQQSIFLSYFWLKEALRFQKPKVVILDAKFMYNLHPEDAINTVESLTRKCLDPMKWSPVKMEAVHELCKLNKNQSELSYYLTNIRFHSRWSSIQEYDINSTMVANSELKGFAPLFDKGPNTYNTFESTDKSIVVDFAPIMQEYLDKIVQLCKERDIQFVLVDLPGNGMSDGINNSHEIWASNVGIAYYNLCSTKYYNEIGAVLPEESAVGHQNIWGARKTSKFIGKLLSEEYGLSYVEDEQYEKTKDYYAHMLKDAELSKITTQEEYLQAINDPYYAAFFCYQGNSNIDIVSEDAKKSMQDLGLKCEFFNCSDKFYVASVVGGNVDYEKTAGEGISYVGSFRNKNSIYTLISSKKESAINIGGGQYSRVANGLNIAIYDLKTNKVIDKVTFEGSDVIR